MKPVRMRLVQLFHRLPQRLDVERRLRQQGYPVAPKAAPADDKTMAFPYELI